MVASRKSAKKVAARKSVVRKTAKKVAKVSRKSAKKVVSRKSHKGARAGSAFMKPVKPSAALAAVVGAKPLPRTEVTKKLWAYIKKNKLQDSKQRRIVHADALLKPIFGAPKLDMFKMTAKVAKHLTA